MTTALERARRELPPGVDDDPLSQTTLADLQWACLIELDLIEEGQDGTDPKHRRDILRWLKKWGRPEGT